MMKIKKLRYSRRKALYLSLIPLLFLLNFITLYPFIYGVYLSLHDVNILRTQKFYLIGFAEFIGLKNFIDALSHPYVPPALLFTFFFTSVSVTIEFLLGLGLAMLANRQIRGMTLIRSILLMPLMVTPVVSGLVWRVMFWPDIGVLNWILTMIGLPRVLWFSWEWSARLAIVMVDVWQNTPFLFLVLLSGLMTLPREPYEAALVDGASKWQTFRYVTLPLLTPIILVGLVFRTLAALGTYDVVFATTQGRPGVSTYPFPFFIYHVTFRMFNLGWGAALGWIMLAITFVVSQVFIRWLRGR